MAMIQFKGEAIKWVQKVANETTIEQSTHKRIEYSPIDWSIQLRVI